MTRTTTALLVGLLCATALAGCFGSAETADQPDDRKTGHPATDSVETTPPPAADSGSSAPEPSPPATRADVAFEESGAIEGPFEKSWPVMVPEAGYKNVLVSFQLLPSQDGAPPTARVFLSFDAPDGTSLRSVTLGLGGQDKLEYVFNPDELPPGEYTLRASAERTEIGGIPSMGFATYELHTLTDY